MYFSIARTNRLEQIQATIADNIRQIREQGASTIANDLARAFPVIRRNRNRAQRGRGRPYIELGFKITCLDGPVDSLLKIKHDILKNKGLGKL